MSEKEYGCEDTCRMRENLIIELAPQCVLMPGYPYLTSWIEWRKGR